MSFNLNGKTVLITGASRGIGAAAVKLCHAAGARVLPHASGPSDKASAVAEAAGLGSDDFLYQDLSVHGAGFALAQQAIEKAGRLDAVVNNAGVYLASPLTGDTGAWDEGWAKTMAVNVQAPADICRATIAHFREHGGGTIVNIASRAGHRGDGLEKATYAASKGAVLAMTKTWARGLSGENILLYAIAPGWVETRMAPEDIEARKYAVNEIPLGRVAQPEEVAETILFLLSGACPSMTGATLDINGASYVR
ncbi:SDR family NAD(P)-dependent oxidoreductase [Hyphococcus flavus]|uniref:SDR family NAD(P)-dependent oxidoreductase n=1 Tax=Hyphococcus flavus TaxID=1866326 RepID=A0AAE9ZK00_9PROT|nr:SDR family oxidoreductase [Hyphococcus flavus]WDI32541.1 SDR family NAD(P)-dependent oxidoreductase [Hyphococcus flavus]